MRARWVGLTAVLAVGVLTACGSGMQEATPSPIGPPPGAPDRWKPAVDDTWQWQLAGPPNTAYDVAVYDIDLFDTPTATIDALQEQGRRIVCYFSAGSSEEWRPDFGRFMASDMASRWTTRRASAGSTRDRSTSARSCGGVWSWLGAKAAMASSPTTSKPMGTTRGFGQSLPNYIREHILAPLKLTHTSFPTTAAFPDPHAQGYTNLQGVERTATDWNPSWGWAAGNMISTLEDMRIWARALATGALLTPETQRQRLDTAVPMNPQKSAFYGLGIFNAGGWIGHTGVIFGYQTAVFYLPQTQTTLVFFMNTDVPHEAGTTMASAITNVISPDHIYR